MTTDRAPHLPFDVARCHGIGCERRESCLRFKAERPEGARLVFIAPAPATCEDFVALSDAPERIGRRRAPDDGDDTVANLGFFGRPDRDDGGEP